MQVRRILAPVLAVGMPIGVVAALVPFRVDISSAAVALLLVVVITGCAVYGSAWNGVLAAAASAVAFDDGFAPPYGVLTITRRNDVETTVLLFVIGAATAWLSTRARRGRALAASRVGYLAMLHDFAEMVATGEPAEFVVIRAAAELSALLDLRDCRFEASASDPKLPRLEAGGEVYVQGTRWGVDELGMPGSQVELLVESHGQSRGRFLLTPTTGRPVPLDRRIVAVALADQVGAALSDRLRRDE